MNRETFELDENETCMSLLDFTPLERKCIILGMDKLLHDKSRLLRKYTPIVDKDGSPVSIVLEWKYNRDIMKEVFDINKMVTRSVNEVLKDLFEKSLYN